MLVLSRRKRVGRNRASRGHHVRAVLAQYLGDRGAHPLRPGYDKRSATRESEIEAHVVISSLAMAAPSSVKR